MSHVRKEVKHVRIVTPFSYKTIGTSFRPTLLDPKDRLKDGLVSTDVTLKPPTKKDEGGTANHSSTSTQETLKFIQNKTQLASLTNCLELPHPLAIQLLPRLEQSALQSQPEKKKTVSSTIS